MPVKQITVQFDLDIELFTRILAHSNQGVKFSVYGDDKPQQIEAPEPQRALPAPNQGARHLILTHLKKHDDRTLTTNELVMFCANYGFTARRCGYAQYRISKAGAKYE
jgi:hypothetical protein